MGDKYAVTMQQGAISTVLFATGTDAVGELTSGVTTHRPRVYDMIFSHGTAPGDTVIRWEIGRITVTGAGTGITENSLDPDAPAADVLAEEEIGTTGFTVVADSQFLDFDLNQRATFRWVAAPGGEILMPATAAFGLGWNASSATVQIARTSVHWEE